MSLIWDEAWTLGFKSSPGDSNILPGSRAISTDLLSTNKWDFLRAMLHRSYIQLLPKGGNHTYLSILPLMHDPDKCCHAHFYFTDLWNSRTKQPLALEMCSWKLTGGVEKSVVSPMFYQQKLLGVWRLPKLLSSRHSGFLKKLFLSWKLTQGARFPIQDEKTIPT